MAGESGEDHHWRGWVDETWWNIMKLVVGQNAAPRCWGQLATEARQAHQGGAKTFAIRRTWPSLDALQFPMLRCGWWVESVTVKLLLAEKPHKTTRSKDGMPGPFASHSFIGSISKHGCKLQVARLASCHQLSKSAVPTSKFLVHACSEGALDLKGPTVVRNPRPRPSTTVAQWTAVCTELVSSAGDSTTWNTSTNHRDTRKTLV